MTIEYITSKNLYLLIRDTLKLMNANVIEHGMRVSYIMSEMMEADGGYEQYEIADLMLLGIMHDIGAFKTDDVRKTLTYEAKNPLPHSIYGYLFLKYLSPFEEQSKMILYHHVDTNKMRTINFTYKKETEILKVAEMVDIWHKAFGEKFDLKMLERYRDTKFAGFAIDLIYQANEKVNLFEEIESANFEEKIDKKMDYILLSDDEKDKYIRLMMYCTGLKDENLVANTIKTICVCRELGAKLKLSEIDRNEVYYAALLHDIGMLSLPIEYINSPRKLDEEEVNLIRTHVDIMEKILTNRVSNTILDIAVCHHERFDGTGYPKGRKAGTMNQKEAILQLAETVVNMSIDKGYRKAFTKEEIFDEVNNGIISGKYEGLVADTLLKNYDDIMKKADEKAKQTLVTHQKLKYNSDQVYKNFMGA